MKPNKTRIGRKKKKRRRAEAEKQGRRRVEAVTTKERGRRWIQASAS